MPYIKLNQDSSTVYPYELWRLREDFPNTSFPQPYELAALEDFGVFQVETVEPPAHDAFTQTLAEDDPLNIDGVWRQQWSLRAATSNELEARKAALIESITAQTQERLDAFARTREYDGILSACTYATSSVPKFKAEGQYCVDARDATWNSLYTMMAEVEAGTRPMPTGYADIEADLPPLAWPAA